jgi:hypothetical protein
MSPMFKGIKLFLNSIKMAEKLKEQNGKEGKGLSNEINGNLEEGEKRVKWGQLDLWGRTAGWVDGLPLKGRIWGHFRRIRHTKQGE